MVDGKKSREAAVAFLEYLAQKGLMAPATARARKAAVNTVLGILDNHEAQDVTSINLDDVMNRFANLQGKEYNPASLRTYKSRVRSALDDFASYVENPLAFKPSLQSRDRKPNPVKTSSSAVGNVSDDTVADVSRPSVPVIAGPMASSILPIPIRAELTIYIQGLPYDLTPTEAKKIASVIQAMATPI
jgi:hypothetical protein